MAKWKGNYSWGNQHPVYTQEGGGTVYYLDDIMNRWGSTTNAMEQTIGQAYQDIGLLLHLVEELSKINGDANAIT